MRVLGVIPARYGATRLPGKPLVDIGGKTLVQRVWERASSVPAFTDVVVATDDDRVADHVRELGGKVELTSPDHFSGTDRLGEVALRLEYDYYVNVQGDEPLLDIYAVEKLVTTSLERQVEMSTLVTPLTDDVENPNLAKVVRDSAGYAMYFSRSVIPHPRNPGGEYFKHIGIYMYSRATLLRICSLPPAMLEQAESLEQLRALYNGIRILTVECDFDSVEVNAPEDVAKVLARLTQATA